MLVAMALSMILFGALVLIMTSYMRANTYDAYRDNAQDSARQVIDRMSRDLRSASNSSTPGSASAGMLEEASAYDMAFLEVNPSGNQSGDVTNQVQVRYCLDSSNTLWRQSTPVSSSYATLPDTSTCPSTSSAWVQTSAGTPCCVVLGSSAYQTSTSPATYVTNRIGGDTTRPLLTYGFPTGSSTSAPTASQLSQINQVEISLYVEQNPNVNHTPGPTELTSGIYFRNELSAPTASFSWTLTAATSSTRYVNLNGSGASDPNGQELSYQWYTGGSCANGDVSGGTAIAGATTQSYTTTTTYSANTTQVFTLVVTDTAGLTGCQSETVNIT